MIAMVPVIAAAQQFLANVGPPVDPDARFEVVAIKAFGEAVPEPLPADQQPSSARIQGAPSERVPGSRRRVTTPVRVEIATAGDLAYEFSHSEVVFDLENGEREVVSPASVLRVWKKDNGQWKIAALFARPHYQEAAGGSQ